MNKAEYSNAIRDLLGLDMDNSAGLPADDSGYGFDNIGDVLTVSPLHMEKYVSSARRISRLAVGTLKAEQRGRKVPGRRFRKSDSLDAMPINERGEILLAAISRSTPNIRSLVRVRGNPAAGLPPPKLDVRLDGKRVKLIDAEIDTAEANQGTRSIEVRMPLPAGPHAIGAGFLTESAKLETGGGGGRGGAPAPTPSPNGVSVEYISDRRPLQSDGSGRHGEPAGASSSAVPRRVRPEDACARQILASLGAPGVSAAGDGDRYRSADEAVRGRPRRWRQFRFRHRDGLERHSGLARVSVPRGESPGGRVAKGAYVSSCAIWIWPRACLSLCGAAFPDEELLGLAEKGKLHDPAVLAAQVGACWPIRNPRRWWRISRASGCGCATSRIGSPIPTSSRTSTTLCATPSSARRNCSSKTSSAEDRSVLEFIDADYTFLNERLARYYGIPGVKGSYFRRVALKGPERGGILTQASVLMVTSYPTRTSPVLRGKWILESILDAPPPPPPPNVPPLDDARQHFRQEPARDSSRSIAPIRPARRCHSRLDPLGFSLENFDAVGKYRTKEGDAPIDASGQPARRHA